MTPGGAEARYPDEPGERHHTYLFAIDDDVVIDAAVDGNDARFINHSCDPNCDAVIDDARIWIETIRDIEPGEELAYDYAYVLEERHTPAAKRRYPVSLRRGEMSRDDPGEEAGTGRHRPGLSNGELKRHTENSIGVHVLASPRRRDPHPRGPSPPRPHIVRPIMSENRLSGSSSIFVSFCP